MRVFVASILTLAGFALLASAAFILHPAAGLGVAGLGLVWFGIELGGSR